MISAHWTATFDAAGIRRSVDKLAMEAVTAGATVGGRTAARIAGQRRKTGTMADIRVEPARRITGGYAASFYSPSYNAWWQNYGTLGSRTKELKRAPTTTRTRAPGTGVKPLYFLNRGLGAGRVAMYGRVGARRSGLRF
jgi:hypothetical protein